MTLRRRLALLEQKVPRPDPTEKQARQHWAKISDRFFTKVERAMALMTGEEESQAEKAVIDLADSGGVRVYIGPWMLDLVHGRSRVPKLSDAVMKDLLLLWLTPGITGCVTCKVCGLQYPHRDSHVLLEACPACSSPAWDWTQLVPELDRNWKKRDGYADSPLAKV